MRNFVWLSKRCLSWVACRLGTFNLLGRELSCKGTWKKDGTWTVSRCTGASGTSKPQPRTVKPRAVGNPHNTTWFPHKQIILHARRRAVLGGDKACTSSILREGTSFPLRYSCISHRYSCICFVVRPSLIRPTDMDS